VNVGATNITNVSEDVTKECKKCRLWYMSGGTQWPLPAAMSSKSGRRMALIWPEEDPGSDRITNQLMFVPPFPSAGDVSSDKLKKILFYTEVGRWFPITPGRSMFTKARCPVDTCTMLVDQNQTQDADAIIFHNRFAHPHHPRPPRQVICLTVCTHGVPLKVEIECCDTLCRILSYCIRNLLRGGDF
jgi:glycoprotein 3-alpha-L-fucosyltransferase